MTNDRVTNIKNVASVGGFTLCSVGVFNAGNMKEAPICVNCKHSSLSLHQLCEMCSAIRNIVTGDPILCERAREAEDACGPLAKLFEQR